MDEAIKYAEAAAKNALSRNAGENEILGAQRFLKDLERQGTQDFPFVYSEKRAADMIEFSQKLILAEGDDPQPFNPADFQAFVMANWNGWIIKDTNNRRFRTSYIQIGRQNGKSVMNAIPSLYYGNFDGYKYPQVYATATKELQARIVLKECIKFIKADPELEQELFKIREYRGEIECLLTGGTIKALGRDTDSIDGFRPYFGSVDEYHKHKTNQMYKLLTDGCKKLKSCLVSIITTAGFDLNGPCKGEYDYAKNILNGFSDETHFVFVADPNPEDIAGERIWDEKTWQTAHPLWTPETKISLQADAIKAREKGGEDLLDFMTKDLNVWVQASERGYLNNQKWAECASDTTVDDMEGRACYLGLDLSAGGDLTSGSLDFPLEDGRFFIESHSFMPENRLLEHEQTDKAPYRIWVREGLLTLTQTGGGYITDYKYILQYYKDLVDRLNLNLLGIAYDPHGASAFLADLEDTFNCDLIEINQSARSLNDPTDHFRNCVDAKKIIYDRKNTLLAWSFRNAVITSNSFGEIKLSKDYAEKRIDPCDATIDAHKLAMNEKTDVDVSKYDLEKWWSLE